MAHLLVGRMALYLDNAVIRSNVTDGCKSLSVEL